MNKEEFKQKLKTDEALGKAFNSDPMKVIQENNIELTLEDLANIAGGVKGGCTKNK